MDGSYNRRAGRNALLSTEPHLRSLIGEAQHEHTESESEALQSQHKRMCDRTNQETANQKHTDY